jgi:ligand-binding sensor domain-containing protein
MCDGTDVLLLLLPLLLLLLLVLALLCAVVQSMSMRLVATSITPGPCCSAMACAADRHGNSQC